jgi:uncharacterized membrane protein
MLRWPTQFSRWFDEPTALNAYLVRLIFVGLVPILVFSVFMMVLFARQEQANRQRGLEDTARALALAVDREIGLIDYQSAGAGHL